MDNTIVFEDFIAEESAAAAMNFAAEALNMATHRIIQESGAITANEVATIENLYTKIITEAMGDFVPSDDELQKMIQTLQEAGYNVVKADEAPAQAPATGNNGAPIAEGADLAASIAAKLEIL